MIRIKSKQHNFRRCGMPHPEQPVEYPDGRFTPAELAILQAEPMLVVEVVADSKSALVPAADPPEKEAPAAPAEAPIEAAPDPEPAPAPAPKPAKAGRKGAKK